MTTLFDHARIPLWYACFWIVLVVVVRLWIVGPVLKELRASRAAAAAVAEALRSVHK